MAYVRRRSTYRRKARRGNRTLSTRRIFSNKGAKAQAKQIYALRRSVNRVARMCKPEIKAIRTGIVNDVIGLNNIYPGVTISNYKIYSGPTPDLGSSDSGRDGNIVRLLPFKINFASQYKKIINSVSTPIATQLLNTSGGVRMIVLQSKSALINAPTPAEVLQDTPTALGDSVGILTTPFVKNITARFNILYNKVIYYSENQLIKCKNIKVRPAVRTMRWEDGYTYPLGQIWVMLFAGGFTFVDVGSGDTPYDYDVCDYAIKFEQPFTDV